MRMTRRTFIGSAANSAVPLLGNTGPQFVGITVMPEYIQAEGIDRVLDNIASRAGANAVTTSPYVMAPADAKTGSREPPIDAGAGKVRLLDRPLWGKRELFVRTAPSFTPDLRLYKGLRYQPPCPDDLTRSQGPLIRDFIRAARARKLKVYLQIQAAIPPGYRVQFGGPVTEDQPRLPDGRIPPRRVANNGSLASAEIRNYTHALIRDLCQAYPEIDGLRVDWPEYPPYLLDDVFLDFSRAAEASAARFDLPFGQMRREAGELYSLLHGGLTNELLMRWMKPRLDLFSSLEWTRLKAMLVDELLAGFRRTLTEAGGAGKELLPNAFPPPFSIASGMDYSRAARHSAAISVKLYTMHWPMMLRFYGDALREANPGVDERLLTRALAAWFDIADDGGFVQLFQYSYPEPHEAHPVGIEAQRRKLRSAQQSSGQVPIIALAHGYGPVQDYGNRLRVAYEAAGERVWINRYGYLSDEKLEVTKAVCRS